MRRRFLPTLTLTLTLLAGALWAGAAATVAEARPFGHSRVVARVPTGPQDPGFPEGIVVAGRTAWVSTPAQSAHYGDAYVYALNLRDGKVERKLAVHPQDTSLENGYAGMAIDRRGRLYLAGQQGLVRIDPTTAGQTLYASFPDLYPCLEGISPPPCSPTTVNRPAFPNDVTFDSAGYAYVTDSWQATVWRVPPGPGRPEVFCQYAELDGVVLGPNGVRLHPNGLDVAVAVSGPPGAVYLLRRQGDGCRVRRLHSYPLELPDGLAFGASGRLYVTLAGSNEVSVLRRDGSERARFAGPAGGGGGSVPWDAPASVARDGRRLLVVNHALFTGLVDRGRFAVFDVFVGDRPFRLARPAVP